ncbi:hypothetical protein [Fodinicola acaciae]|uniref:hypothetical protein n=1 Tax=Fodinicola acaciae TaxID=2681555 RepID=UPI0013D8A487|nr:hypothetical protein [Fodinicola acaciae]
MVGDADGGPSVPAARIRVSGRDRIARVGLGYCRRAGTTVTGATINGELGVVISQRGTTLAVLSLTTRDGVVQRIRAIVNPDKLRHFSGTAFGELS